MSAGACNTQTHLATTGNCVGNQSDSDNMTFVVGAAGIISGDYLTLTTASNLTIDNNKILRVMNNGF